jgi:hypothetical protein
MSLTTSCGLRAWRLDAIEPAIHAKVFKCSLDEARNRINRARREFGDPVRVRDVLDKLSAAALAALGVLIEAGGLMEHDELVDSAAKRFEMTPRDVEHGLFGLMAAPLVIPLVSGDRRLVAVLDVAAQSLATLATGLAFPAVDAGSEIVPAPEHDDGRGLLATCMMLLHHEVKVTQSGAPHRAAVKRLAKLLGLAEAKLADDLETALCCDFAWIADDVLRPRVGRVAAAAAGSFAHLPMLDAFVRALREAVRPVPAEAVKAWMTAAARLDYTSSPIDVGDLAKLPGIRRGLDGKHDVLESCALPDAAAATITPSFEVFLTPEVALVHLVAVLACAEPVRIDRVVVARITKESIRRAVAEGATGDGIVASLSAASRTPVPQNVVASIADWASGATFAATALGRVIVVPADAHDRTATALQTFAPQILAPGVLVVAADVSAASVARALDKAGIAQRRADHTSDPEEAVEAPAVTYPPLRTGDPALQRRIAAYRAGDSAERARGPSGTCSCGSTHEHHDDDEFGITDVSMERVERWERDRQPLSDEQATVFAALLDVAKRPDREFLLAAKTTNELTARIHIVMVERDGFGDLLRTHREAFARHLPAALDKLASEEPADLDWFRSDIAPRLVAAQRTCATLALDLGAGGTRVARILKVSQQGRAAMLLAEDVTDGSSIAVPVTAVRGVAEPAEYEAATTSSSSPSGPWRPLPGQSPPPGHVPCPCGSGRRYRACCREASVPS